MELAEGPEESCSARAAAAVSCHLERLARIQRGMLAFSLEEIGLYAGQENALASLWEHGPMTQTRLSALVGVDTSTMSRTLQRLERAGYIVRTSGSTDRRTTLVAATEAADLLRDQLTEVYDRTEERLVSGLDVDERRHLAELIRKAIDALEPGCTDELERRSARFFPEAAAAQH